MNRYKPRIRIASIRGAGFFTSLKQSAIEHGYRGKINILFFFFKRLINNSRHLLARIIPINGLRISLHKARGVTIGKNTTIGPFVFIDEVWPDYVYIDDFAGIALGSTILAHTKAPFFQRNNYMSYVDPVIIEKGVWVGARSLILPGVTVGEGSVITAGSIVSRDGCALRRPEWTSAKESKGDRERRCEERRRFWLGY